MPRIATDVIAASTTYAYDLFDNLVDKNGAPSGGIPTTRDVIIDSVELVVDTMSTTPMSLTWELVLDANGNESISGELTDVIVVGAASTGKVFRASPVRVRLSAQPRLRVKTNTGTCNVEGKLSFHVPRD